MHLNRKWIFAAIPLISLIAIESSYAQAFYKWTDEHGVMQYTQTPPPQRAVKKVVESTQSSQDSAHDQKIRNDHAKKSLKMSSAEEQAAESAKKNVAAEADLRNKNGAACQQLKLNLSQLKSGQRFRTLDVNGTVNYLSEEQKAAQIKQQTAQIQYYCP